MKHLHTLIQQQITQPPKLQIRNNREQLIADIVNATTEKNKQKLARALAVAANVIKWQDSDFQHAATEAQRRDYPKLHRVRLVER